jgi:hypothetical protein
LGPHFTPHLAPYFAPHFASHLEPHLALHFAPPFSDIPDFCCSAAAGIVTARAAMAAIEVATRDFFNFFSLNIKQTFCWGGRVPTP